MASSGSTKLKRTNRIGPFSVLGRRPGAVRTYDEPMRPRLDKTRSIRLVDRRSWRRRADLVEPVAPRRREIPVTESASARAAGVQIPSSGPSSRRKAVLGAVAVELEVGLVEATLLLAGEDRDEGAEVADPLRYAGRQRLLIGLEPVLVSLFLADFDRVARLRDEAHGRGPPCARCARATLWRDATIRSLGEPHNDRSAALARAGGARLDQPQALPRPGSNE